MTPAPWYAPRAMQQARNLRRRVGLHDAAPLYPAEWLIEDDEKVPQSRSHHLRGGRLEQLLLGWKARTGRDAQVGRELALRWDERVPKVGVDPDVYVVEPPPPEGDEVTSLRTWEKGHHPPLLAVEIVSPSRPEKDYTSSPLKYAASGTRELWIFDPNLAGPKVGGGPFRLQVWARNAAGLLPRVYTGEGPVYSQALAAWVLTTDRGRSLAIADDESGARRWVTPEETERAAKEAAQKHLRTARAAKKAAQEREITERAAKEEALRRIAELEALLPRGG
jgi:Uma2 family endonuclease